MHLDGTHTKDDERQGSAIGGIRLWNDKFNLANNHSYKNALERLSRNILLKHINKFVTS